ncbi:MAG: PglZ domain-containing protein [Gammaproteobacteria bacterium]|nr:PglZ domain-containing protein [Gammaproteobacteria bacterium]
MILQALVNQFSRRFQHEKRAQVCLWFDEKEEFIKLLPSLRAHLGSMDSPPFLLLEYDAPEHHGQVWLKHQVHRTLNALSSEESRQQRFVMYLPLPEDHLVQGGPGGAPALDMLAEYRTTGVSWRVDGKRPTLFRFLKQTGVELPGLPRDQQRIYDGGRNSLLAKYVAKFADRPATFWAVPLSPALVQERLVGDVDQTILDLAALPEPTWQDLDDKGLISEFLGVVRERYGFEAPADGASNWVKALATTLALTETFLGYGEPDDFPLADRLPPQPVRTHHQQLLHRWLRDSESRAAWDRLIQEVETELDLSNWARDKVGFCFGFPHLVQMRWQEVAGSFAVAATKSSSTAAFFTEHGALIAKEAEHSRASLNPAGAWDLLRQLQDYLGACEEATRLANEAESVDALVRVFVSQAPVVDAAHITLRHDAERQGLPSVAKVADRTYATYTNMLNGRFFKRYVARGSTSIDELPYVTDHLERRLWNANGKRAVVIVDALRYDCAYLIRQTLQSFAVTLEPMRAAIPTVTPVGMTALMPLAEAEVSCDIQANSLHPRVNGKDAAARSNRVAYLRDFGADCREIGQLEATSDTPAGLGELLVVFGHGEVDHIGHGNARALVRHLHGEVERIARLVRTLHRWNYPVVHVITDHGFILLDEDNLPDEVACNAEWCRVKKERYALVPAEADLPVASLPFGWDPSLRVALPPGLAFFKGEKPFSHGGVALQELVIPHLVSRCYPPEAKRLGLEVVLPVFELTRTAVKVSLRPERPASPESPQMTLFAAPARTVSLDVLRLDSTTGAHVSVLASGGPKEVRVDPEASEQDVTLFFHTAKSFRAGEILHLDIRDTETTEQFPPGGIKLTIGRDM